MEVVRTDLEFNGCLIVLKKIEAGRVGGVEEERKRGVKGLRPLGGIKLCE